MTVVGSKKMVMYDDVSADARIVVYDKGVSRKPGAAAGRSFGEYASFADFQLLLRAGDVLIPRIDFSEPLRLECEEFLEAIRTGKPPMTGGSEGLRVVQVLEAAQRSLRNGGVQCVES